MTVQSQFAGFNWDDAIYLLMADAYSNRLADFPELYRTVFQWRDYPPGYAMFLALFGGGSGNIGRAFVANSLAITLSIWAVFTYAKRLTKDWVLAIFAAASFLFSAAVLLYAYELWSENLFIALLLAALATVHSNSRRALPVAAILLAAAAVTRSAGLAFCTGFVLWLMWKRPPRAVTAGLIALVIPLIERALHSGAAYTAHIEGYTLSSHFIVDFLSVITALMRGVASDLSLQDQLGWFTAIILSALSIVALWRLRLLLESVMLAVYIAMLLLWGYPEHAARFVYPLIPILIVLGLTGAARLGGRLHAARAKSWVRIGAAIMLLAIGYPTVARVHERWSSPDIMIDSTLRRTTSFLFGQPAANAVSYALYRRQLIIDSKRIGGLIDRSSCVVTEFPPVVLLHARRVAVIPPWQHWNEIRTGFTSPCRYYYALPAYLDGIDPSVLIKQGAELLFQSPGFDPDHPGEATGMFFDFKPDK